MKHRTVRQLRTVLLVLPVAAALLGVAVAVAGGGVGVLAVRVGFLTAAAAIVAGALRWSVAPSSSPVAVAGAVALWVLALHGAAAIGGVAALVVTLAVLGLVVLGPLTRGTTDASAVAPHGGGPHPVRLPDRHSLVPSLAVRPTPDLCAVWTETGAEIGRVSSADRVAWLLEVREAVLAELERRDPDGVQRWLASAPPATSSPLPYVREQHEPPHQAA